MNLLKPSRYTRKAVLGAAVGFFTALGGAIKDGNVSAFEIVGITSATVIGYLTVWAGKNADVEELAE